MQCSLFARSSHPGRGQSHKGRRTNVGGLMFLLTRAHAAAGSRECPMPIRVVLCKPIIPLLTSRDRSFRLLVRNAIGKRPSPTPSSLPPMARIALWRLLRHPDRLKWRDVSRRNWLVLLRLRHGPSPSALRRPVQPDVRRERPTTACQNPPQSL
jgi:hypothetical protein